MNLFTGIFSVKPREEIRKVLPLTFEPCDRGRSRYERVDMALVPKPPSEWDHLTHRSDRFLHTSQTCENMVKPAETVRFDGKENIVWKCRFHNACKIGCLHQEAWKATSSLHVDFFSICFQLWKHTLKCKSNTFFFVMLINVPAYWLCLKVLLLVLLIWIQCVFW